MSKRTKSKKEEEICENAEKNPVCPYVTQINQITSQISTTNAVLAATASTTTSIAVRIDQQGNDLREIKKALVGEDLQGGIVEQLAKLKLMYKIIVFISGTCIASLIGIVLKIVFNL